MLRDNRKLISSAIAVFLIAVVVGSKPSTAAPLIFVDNEASFQIQTGSLNIEGFEGLVLSTAAEPTISTASFDVSVSAFSTTSYLLVNDVASYISEGNQAVEWANSSASDVIFSFASPITAFAVDFNHYSPDNEISLIYSLGAPTVIFAAGTPGPIESHFFGLVDVDNPFTEIRFSATTFNHVAFDRVQFGEGFKVPEPATSMVVLICSVVFIFLSRCMKHQSRTAQ